MTVGEIVPGVRELDHTADLGLDVRAGSLEELFDRAARGMLAVVRATGEDERWEPGDETLRTVAACPPGAHRARRKQGAGEATVERRIDVQTVDVAGLLVAWLQELLYLMEAEGLAYSSARFEELREGRLRARVRAVPDAGPIVRELKGITYHGLVVRRDESGWVARVIFDI